MVVHTQTEPGRRRGIVRPVMLTLLFLAMTVPVYLLVVNSFKTQEDILNNPFSLPVGDLTLDYLWAAVNSPSTTSSAATGSRSSWSSWWTSCASCWRDRPPT